MVPGYERNRMGAASSQSQTNMPVHLYFILVILLLLLGFSWYVNYEYAMEDLFDHLRIVFWLSPLFLLLVVHWLAKSEGRWYLIRIPLPEKDSIHRAGGTPWGVAALLVLLLYMIYYRSSFQESWFPLLTR